MLRGAGACPQSFDWNSNMPLAPPGPVLGWTGRGIVRSGSRGRYQRDAGGHGKHELMQNASWREMSKWKHRREKNRVENAGGRLLWSSGEGKL